MIDCLCVLRNEIDLVRPFLSHHRALGVDRFVMIDNGSTDGTREYLAGQDDVLLVDELGSYRDSRAGIAWLNREGEARCRGNWTLILDADEFFLPPRPNENLLALASRMEGASARALPASMVTMMPSRRVDGSPSGCSHEQASSLNDLLRSSPWYAPRGLHVWRDRNRFPYVDMRCTAWARLGQPEYNPSLLKLAFVRWSPGFRLLQANHVTSDVDLSTEIGLLAHLKFRAGVTQRGRSERQRGERMNREVATAMSRMERRLDEERLQNAGFRKLSVPYSLRDTDWCDPDGSVRALPSQIRNRMHARAPVPAATAEDVRVLLAQPVVRRTRALRGVLARWDLVHHTLLAEQMLAVGDTTGAYGAAKRLERGWPGVAAAVMRHCRRRIAGRFTR